MHKEYPLPWKPEVLDSFRIEDRGVVSNMGAVNRISVLWESRKLAHLLSHLSNSWALKFFHLYFCFM